MGYRWVGHPPSGAKATPRALAYLAREQRPDGSWLPLWFGNQHAPDDVNPVYGTSRVLAAYRDDGEPAQVCERMVDLDEGFQEWRYRHVKMVERTIGAKAGTGGSPGAKYLHTTLNQPMFPDLWSVRSEL